MHQVLPYVRAATSSHNLQVDERPGMQEGIMIALGIADWL
jgi:hypothetical protein